MFVTLELAMTSGAFEPGEGVAKAILGFFRLIGGLFRLLSSESLVARGIGWLLVSAIGVGLLWLAVRGGRSTARHGRRSPERTRRLKDEGDTARQILEESGAPAPEKRRLTGRRRVADLSKAASSDSKETQTTVEAEAEAEAELRGEDGSPDPKRLDRDRS